MISTAIDILNLAKREIQFDIKVFKEKIVCLRSYRLSTHLLESIYKRHDKLYFRSPPFCFSSKSSTCESLYEIV